jgi:hypothetical protein
MKRFLSTMAMLGAIAAPSMSAAQAGAPGTVLGLQSSDAHLHGGDGLSPASSGLAAEGVHDDLLRLQKRVSAQQEADGGSLTAAHRAALEQEMRDILRRRDAHAD